MITQTGDPIGSPPQKNIDKNTNKNNDLQKEGNLNSYDLTNKYSKSDKGPFLVYVEHTEKNLGRVFPIKIGYYFLSEDKIKNDILDIQSVGRNRVKVIFKSFEIANSIINHKCIKNNNLIAYIPKYFTQKKGVIRNVDTFFTEEYLKSNIISSKQVVNVQRMKRKTIVDGETKFIDRQMVIVTFLGNEIPKSVKINLTNFTVDNYIYPVVQCFRCLRYGHTSKLCKSKDERCKKCSSVHEENETCDMSQYCVHCETNTHSSISKDCPYYKQQRKIKEKMAQENISFKEAENLIKNPSYAKVITNNRFNVLNTLENFPTLPNTSSLDETSPISTNYPTFRKPIPKKQSMRQNDNFNKKRKAMSPPTSPMPGDRGKKASSSYSILPNPYRDQFIKFKESIVDGISLYINNYIKTSVPTEYHTPLSNESTIRQYIEKLLHLENSSEIMEYSDDDSLY